MKHQLFIAFTTLISLTTFAAKPGIGISVQQDGGAIYLPIDIGDHFRLEPVIEGYWGTSKYTDGDEEESSRIDLELGLFGRTEVIDKLSAYYGARVGYTYFRREYSSTDPNRESAYESHGVSAAPTLGIEYYFVERFSIAGEVAWEFYYYDSSGNFQTEHKYSGTESRLVARYYF